MALQPAVQHLAHHNARITVVQNLAYVSIINLFPMQTLPARFSSAILVTSLKM